MVQHEWLQAVCPRTSEGEALLDLNISDVEPSSVEVLVAQVADPNAVLAQFDVAMAEATVVERMVFD